MKMMGFDVDKILHPFHEAMALFTSGMAELLAEVKETNALLREQNEVLCKPIASLEEFDK